MKREILPANRYALKEWAVVVRALASGRQTVLFRKGGIMENRGGFRVEHNEFFLYPTFLHEQAGRVVPEEAKELKAALAERPPEGRIGLSAYAVVEESWALSDPARIEKLRPYHILTAGEVRNRFYYRGRPGLHLLLLRVYHLPNPVALAVTPAYAGCRSWVDLEIELATAGSRPVVSDRLFRGRADEIRSILTGHG